jgi:hypothetical protein
MGSLSTERQMAFLRSYCDQHPLATFIVAVYALTEELKTASPP